MSKNKKVTINEEQLKSVVKEVVKEAMRRIYSYADFSKNDSPITVEKLRKMGFKFSDFNRGNYLGRLFAYRPDNLVIYCGEMRMSIGKRNKDIDIFQISDNGKWYGYIYMDTEETYELDDMNDVKEFVKYAKKAFKKYCENY